MTDLKDEQQQGNKFRSFDIKGWLLFGLVTSVCLLLCFQGWRSTYVGIGEYDRVINLEEAEQFLNTGRLPSIGGVASTGGFTPPGVSWFYLPGLMTGEFRLHERLGAVILYLITLVGLWFLGREVSNTRTALLIVALYGFSAWGLFIGTSMWPRASPGGFAWMIYFLILWVKKQSPLYFVLAVTAWSINSYIYLEVLPSIIGLFLVWAWYRPRLTLLGCFGAAFLFVLVWYPYLKFESTREFSDIKNQLVSRSKDVDLNTAYHGYEEELETYDETVGSFGPFQIVVNESESFKGIGALLHKIFFKVFNTVSNLFGLLSDNYFYGILTAPLFIIAVFAAVMRFVDKLHLNKFEIPHRVIGIGFALLAAVANPFVAGKILGKSLDRQEIVKILVIEGAIAGVACFFLLYNYFKKFLALIVQLWSHDLSRDRAKTTFWLAFLIPWIAICVVSDKTRHSNWIWSGQLVVLGLAASYYPLRARWPKLLVLLLEVAVFVNVAYNGMTAGRANSFVNEGFAGQDRQLLMVMDDIVRENPNEKNVSVGYHNIFSGYEFLYSKYDPRYRLGITLDQYLRIQYGITNKLQPAKGFSPGDRYRVFQNKFYKYRMRFRFADQQNYKLKKEYGDFQLWELKQ